jgi:hypothetical protein
MLKYFKSRGYCCQKDYERFGGDDMLTFLEEAVIPLPNYELLVPSIKLPLFLRQNYSDVGVLSTYDEDIDFDYVLPENEGIVFERTKTDISAESKLTTLRSRKKVFNDETGALEDFIDITGITGSVSGDTAHFVPYEVGGNVNTANTFNTYYMNDKYLGDYITKILYLDDDNKVLVEDTGQTMTQKDYDVITGSTQIEFEYVIGGDFKGEEIVIDECDLKFYDSSDANYPELPESFVVNMPSTGGVIDYIDVTGSCVWTAHIIYDDDEFLNLRHDDEYDEVI